MAEMKETPSQTAGPYIHISCAPQTAGLEPRAMGQQLGHRMVQDPAKAPPICLDITVKDGEGAFLKDAMIEIWQPGPDGTFIARGGFQNWGRQVTDLDTGIARFETCKPAAPEGQAPHVLVWIVARGINIGLTTRIYFSDEDNTEDPTLALAAERASSLIAQNTEQGYAHVIHLQGPQETVFFDV